MTKVKNLKIELKILESWEKSFVFDLEPLFLSSSLLKVIQPMALTYSRPDFNVWLGSQGLEYKDAYCFWNVQSTFVTLLSSSAFDALDLDVQQKLNAYQVQAKRGLIFNLAVAKKFGISEKFLQRDSTKNKFLLRFDAWWSLTQTQRFAWLHFFVTKDLPDALEITHPLTGWCSSSGANCFATALAALETNLFKATNTAKLWLTETVFQRELEARKYKSVAFKAADLPENGVLTWHDSSGKMVHAATLLESGLCLNKDSQAWYSPVQILSLPVLLERWAEPDLTIRLWMKS